MVSRISEPSTVCVLNLHAENLWNPPCQNYSLSEGEGEGNHQFRGSKTSLLKQPILFVGFAKSLLADSQLHLQGSSDDFFTIPTTNLGWDIRICKYHLLFASSRVQSLSLDHNTESQCKTDRYFGAKTATGVCGILPTHKPS